MKKFLTIWAVAGLLLATNITIAGPTYVETLNLYHYQVGGIYEYAHTYDDSADPIAWATLTIVADDVDGPDGDGKDGEQDKVFYGIVQPDTTIKWYYLGLLNDTGFYTDWNYDPGRGNSNYQGAITTTVFNLVPAWINGLPVQIQIEAA